MLNLQVLAMIYQGLYKPGPDRSSNQLDMFNESIITFSTDLMILFSNFNPDLTMQFVVGWY